jgi:hypothetical protein
LKQYWPDHPPIDVVCFDVPPPDFEGGARFPVGRQMSVTWSAGLGSYIEQHNRDQLLLLMLDDYGLCGPVNRHAIREAGRVMLSDPAIGNVHLTWQPGATKQPRGSLLQLPRWSYSINTQAALWWRDLLLEVLQRHSHGTIEQFELDGSAWFNSQRFDRDVLCQVSIPEPSILSDFVVEMDKKHWALPYHNLFRRGAPDPRHSAFLADNKLVIE